MAHWLHLIVVILASHWVHVQLLRGEVFQLRVLFLHMSFLLTSRTFIKKIGLEESLKFHDDNRQVTSFKAFREHFSEQTDHTLVESLVVLGIIGDHTLKLDESVDIICTTVIGKTD